MPERHDPFSDLGSAADPERRDGAEGAGARAIGERLAERDRTHPEPGSGPPPTPRQGNKYAWLVALVMLMGISVLLFTTAIPNSGEGVKGPKPRSRLPVFAAPLATGDLNGDVNVRQGEDEGSDSAGEVPACQVRGPGIMNVCDLWRRPLVLTFVVTRGADCEPQVDRVERMRRAFPGVSFAAVISGEDRAEAERLVRARRWTIPVGVDPDGALVNVYGIGVCPTTVFAHAGGRVRETELGNLTEEELRAKTRRLVRAERRR